MHIVHIISNCTSVPYFNWFAEKAQTDMNTRFSFIALYSEKPKMLEDMRARGADCYWVRYSPSFRKLGYIYTFFRLFWQ